jgi:diaminopimelate decarboxylase
MFNEDLMNVKKLGIQLNALISQSPYENFLKNVKLIYEPGRFLSGQCGICLLSQFLIS